MNHYKEEFNNKKKEIIEILNTTGAFYTKFDYEKESKIFHDIVKNVEDDDFSIVLVGEFSAGKSTFLNALMGERLLPSFTNETTATINYLRHKSRAKNGEVGIVYFKDGTTKVLDEINFNLISEYVSTSSSLGVVKEIKHLDLFLDSKFLEGNVTLVDSPGLNGIADYHRDVTEEQIEKSNASIFMFKANQPGSDTDFKFLAELKNRVKTIIFALNKIDEIKESENETVESVIEKLKESYKKKFPNEKQVPEILGISAYQALVARSNQELDYRGRRDYTLEEKKVLEENSRMINFEDRLWKFMTEGEKAKAMLEGPIEKIIANLGDTKTEIEKEKKVLDGKFDAKDIEAEIESVQVKREGIEKEIKSIEGSIIKKVNLSIDEVKEEFENKAEQIKKINVSRLENWGDIDELLDFESSLKSKIEKDYLKLIKKSEQGLRGKVRNIIEENYEEILESINDDFSESKFDIKITTVLNESDFSFQFGIEKYENKIKELEEKLRNVEQEGNKVQDNLLEANNIEKKRESLKMDLEKIEAERKNYEFMVEPERVYVKHRTQEKEWRDGILGIVTTILVGKKTVEKVGDKVVNEEEIIGFKKMKQNVINDFNKKIEILDDEIKNFNSVDSRQIELKLERKLREEKRLEEELKEMQKSFNDGYLKKNVRALAKRKTELEDYFDEINDECVEKLSSQLSKNKKVYVEVIKKAISTSLEDELNKQKRSLEILEKKKMGSENEKKERMEKLIGIESEIEKIIGQAISIKVSI